MAGSEDAEIVSLHQHGNPLVLKRVPDGFGFQSRGEDPYLRPAHEPIVAHGEIYLQCRRLAGGKPARG